MARLTYATRSNCNDIFISNKLYSKPHFSLRHDAPKQALANPTSRLPTFCFCLEIKTSETKNFTFLKIHYLLKLWGNIFHSSLAQFIYKKVSSAIIQILLLCTLSWIHPFHFKILNVQLLRSVSKSGWTIESYDSYSRIQYWTPNEIYGFLIFAVYLDLKPTEQPVIGHINTTIPDLCVLFFYWK